MEQINESKLQFFMNISHEIRTPMSLIVSPLEKLMDNDPDPERNRSYSIIYRNTQRILRLINQLMDVRKIDKKQMVLRFREMNILDMIGDVYKHFEPIAVSKNILFKINGENPQLKLWVDPLNFDKVIMNLLSNAFKFTPEDGKIVINISSFNQDETEFVRINVVDSGIGIKEDNVE